MSLEKLHCVTSSDWARSSPVAKEAHLLLPQGEEPLVPAGLWYDCAILRKLMYKNKSQHRRTKYYQHLQAVERNVRLLRLTRCDELAAAMAQSIQQGLVKATLPVVSMHRTLGHDQRQLPSFQAAVFTLRRLQAAAAILPKLVKSVHAASRHVLTELGHAFFVPLMLTLLSILARIWALGCQAELNVIQAYNALVAVAPGLPMSLNSAAASEDLPASLACSWPERGVPLPRAVPAAGAASLREAAQVATDRWLLQPVPASDADPSEPTQFLAVVQETRQPLWPSGGAGDDLGVALRRDDEPEQRAKEDAGASSSPAFAYEYATAILLGEQAAPKEAAAQDARPEPAKPPAVIVRPAVRAQGPAVSGAFVAVAVAPAKRAGAAPQQTGVPLQAPKVDHQEVTPQAPLPALSPLLALESKSKKKAAGKVETKPRPQTWEDWLGGVPAQAAAAAPARPGNKKQRKR